MKRFFLIFLLFATLLFATSIFPQKAAAQVCQCPVSCNPGVTSCVVDSGMPYTCDMACCTLGYCPSPTPTLTPIFCFCDNPCDESPNFCEMKASGTHACRSECCGPSHVCPPPPAPPGGSGQIDFSSLINVTLPSSRFTSGTTLGSIITIFLPYIYGAAGLAMLLFLVLGAYQIMISSGDPKQLAAGREKITYAIVGFVIMFSAYWITRLAGEILDIQQIKDIFG